MRGGHDLGVGPPALGAAQLTLEALLVNAPLAGAVTNPDGALVGVRVLGVALQRAVQGGGRGEGAGVEGAGREVANRYILDGPVDFNEGRMSVLPVPAEAVDGDVPVVGAVVHPAVPAIPHPPGRAPLSAKVRVSAERAARQ